MFVPWAASLRSTCDAYASEIAVTDSETSLDFRSIGARSAHVARTLLDLGIKPGDPVGLSLVNSNASVWASFGVRLSGAAETHLNPALGLDEKRYYVELTKLKYVVTSRAMAQEFRAVGCEVLCVEDLGEDDTDLALIPAVPGDANGRIGFTSGTTGRPKAVVQTHGARWIATIMQRATAPTAVGPGNRILLMTPYMHGASVLAMSFLERGAGIILLPGVDLPRVEAILTAGQVDHVFAPPTVLAKLSGAFDSRRFEDIKAVFTGTAPLTSALYEQAREMFGPVLRVTYGKTEMTNPITVLDSRQCDEIYRNGGAGSGVCVGFAAPGVEIQLRDEDGGEASDNFGEIYLRGPQMALGHFDQHGFHRLPEDGFHATGDLGRFDDHGRLYLVGRLADVMKSGGYKVHPNEIEEVLAKTVERGEVCIISLPSDYWGEVIVAVAENAEVDWPEQAAKAVSHLAKHKQPRHFLTIEELPKNVQGKVVRAKVREHVQKKYTLTDGAYPQLVARQINDLRDQTRSTGIK